MVIQAVNQRAKERYLSFLAAMTMVEDRFSDLDRLMTLREIAKRYESELLSREWRV